MLSYTIAARVPEGLLIYAKGEEEPAVHNIAMANKLLTVVSLDLAGDPGDILQQIRTVAERIIRQSQRI